MVSPSSPRYGGGCGFDGSDPPGPVNKSVTVTPWSVSRSGTPMALKLPTIEIVCHIHQKTVWSRQMKDGRPEGRLATRCQVVILGRKDWTTSGRSKVAGRFGTGRWDELVTPSGMRGGMGL